MFLSLYFNILVLLDNWKTQTSSKFYFILLTYYETPSQSAMQVDDEVQTPINNDAI